MSYQKSQSKASHLLVEGRDDLHVVNAICSRYQLPGSFEIISCEGINNLLNQIPILIKLKERRLGILLDADVDLGKRWQQLENLLLPLGYNIPSNPDSKGTIIHSSANSCIVGIWLMPDNRASGMIEDFVRLLIPREDLLLPYAEKVLSNIGTADVSKFRAAHRSKALIHTWLAWQEIPGVPMGQAITKSYLDYNQDLCLCFVNWLNTLFN
ncbi:hypothetical protein SAMN04487996_10671 [Dyadobacter soli]|uniref:DUF4435 domain-containing protein n=1 Tax=Dyadobacter soli TaxID=659014 RepID=A0A1G7EHU2_9BACT|nr:DUF3226 domain-containing protein [Dyadobacter soli]SDE63208.1 hypothetical protein SAMN04487996_10671 [Dyadobacter soli]